MGMNVSLYMGPYLKVRNEKIEELVSVRACLNDECGKKLTESKEKFCSRCGTQIIEAKVPQKRDKVDIWELTEKWNEQLYQAGELHLKGDISVLLPNISAPKTMRKFHMDIESGPSFVENYDSKINPQEELAWFKKQFANEISDLKEQLKEVEVGWGLVRYWS